MKYSRFSTRFGVFTIVCMSALAMVGEYPTPAAPNKGLQRAAGRSSSSGVAAAPPCWLGGWRGRSAPCRLPLKPKVVRRLGSQHFYGGCGLAGLPVRRSAVIAGYSNGRAATVVRIGGAAAASDGLHSGRAARRSVVHSASWRLAAAAPHDAAVGGGHPTAMLRARRARPAGFPMPLAHQRRGSAWRART